MERVTPDEVLEIMDGCTLDVGIVHVYIQSAHVLLNSIFGITIPVEQPDSSAVDDTNIYKEMERWLAAHMIASTRFRIASKEQVGDAKVEYIGKFGMGLNSTPYGQMLMAMDTSGELAAADKRKASIFAIPQYEKR